MILLVSFACIPALAQTTTLTCAKRAQADSQSERQIEKQEQSQRMVGVLPEFGVTNRRNAPPLTTGGKFHLFYRSAFDPGEFAVVAIQSGVNQAEDSFPSYGQGAAGYAKRYGAAFTDEVSSGFFTNFFYPTLLKEDPRYFRLGYGSFRHRLGYALEQEFTAHKDHGGKTFNFSNTLGALSAGALSNAYYPPEDRGFSLTMSGAAISLIYGSVGAVIAEFYPDISRRLFHHREKVPR